MNTLFTRHRAEAWRTANPTPSRPQLTQTHLSPAVVKLALTLLGAMLLGLIGWLR